MITKPETHAAELVRLQKEWTAAAAIYRAAVAAVAAAVAIALPILGLAADTFQGRWRLSGDDWPSQFAWMDDMRADGEFRVLWVGDPTILPTDSKKERAMAGM